MMLSNSHRTNIGVNRRSEINVKAKEAGLPRSPTNVTDSEAYFVDTNTGNQSRTVEGPQLQVDEYNRISSGATCGCFTFFDFFGKGDDNEKDDFMSIPFKDATVTVEGEESRDPPDNSTHYIEEGGGYDNDHSGKVMYDSHRKRGEVITIKEEVVEDLIDLTPRQGQQEVITIKEEEVEDLIDLNHHQRVTPKNDKKPINTISGDEMVVFKDGYGDIEEEDEEEMNEVDNIQLIYSYSSFSEIDQNDYDDNSENDIIRDDEKSSDGSSTLSFDPSEFEEQDFESDYGSLDSNAAACADMEESSNSLGLNSVDNSYLPTIQENVENSFSCDVGSNLNFNHYFCGR